MARPKFAPKVPLPVDRSPNRTTCLISGHVRPMMPNGIRVRSAVFLQCTGQTDRATDRSFTRKFDDAAAFRERHGIIIITSLIVAVITAPRLGSGVLRSVCLSVCLSVCVSVREHISGTAKPRSSHIFVQIPCGCGSVLLWRRCDTLCASGFMDDVTFGRNGPDGDA